MIDAAAREDVHEADDEQETQVSRGPSHKREAKGIMPRCQGGGRALTRPIESIARVSGATWSPAPPNPRPKKRSTPSKAPRPTRCGTPARQERRAVGGR